MRNVLVFISMLMVGLVYPAGLTSVLAETEKTNLTMGGKGISGPYFPTAGTIAKAVNHKRSNHGIRITVKSRRDSVSILTAVLSGKLDCGVVQTRRVRQAVKGLTEWQGSPQTALRSVFNVQVEMIGLVASAQSGIRKLQDLKGRRVFVGSPRSDLHDDVMQILAAAGIDPQSDITTTDAAQEEAPELLQDDAVDAFFFVVGTTNRAFIDLVSKPFKVRLVPISGPDIDEMIATNPFVEKALVSIASYPYFANTSDVETVGFKAGLITTAWMPDRIVYIVTRTVFENFDYYKGRHPASVSMTRNAMTHDMIAPVHPGAEKFFKDSGIGHSTVEQ